MNTIGAFTLGAFIGFYVSLIVGAVLFLDNKEGKNV